MQNRSKVLLATGFGTGVIQVPTAKSMVDGPCYSRSTPDQSGHFIATGNSQASPELLEIGSIIPGPPIAMDVGAGAPVTDGQVKIWVS